MAKRKARPARDETLDSFEREGYQLYRRNAPEPKDARETFEYAFRAGWEARGDQQHPEERWWRRRMALIGAVEALVQAERASEVDSSQRALTTYLEAYKKMLSVASLEGEP